MWRPEDNLWDSVLSYSKDPEIELRVIRLGDKQFYSLSVLTAPMPQFTSWSGGA